MTLKLTLSLCFAACLVSCASGTELEGFSEASPPSTQMKNQVGHAPKAGGASASSTSNNGGSGPSSTSNNGGSDPSSTSPSQEVRGSFVVNVACKNIPVLDLCLIDSKIDEDVPFTLPAGTRRSSIEYTVTPAGPDAHATIGWASDDPLDGTVRVRGEAGPFSSVLIDVTGVMVVPE